MRALGVVAVVGVLSSCVAPNIVVSRDEARRSALAPIPGVPTTLSGGSGLALGMRMLPVAPDSTGPKGGVSMPVIQPELGGVIRLQTSSWAHTAFGLKVVVMSSDLPMHRAAFGPNVRGVVGVDLTAGVGEDFQFGKYGGMTLSTEFGFFTPSFRSTSTIGDLEFTLAQPTFRGATGGYLTLGIFRIYAGASLGTVLWNDSIGTHTRTCDVTCVVGDTGSSGLEWSVMAGGGVRAQFTPVVSVGAEAWVPVTRDSVQVPVVLAATLRVGDFDVLRVKPKAKSGEPVMSPPPPPPQMPQEEVPAPVSL